MIAPRHSHIISMVGTIACVFLGFLQLDRPARAEPALPGELCGVEPRPDWSEIETWVWDRVCHGEIADLNELNEHFRRTLDPRSPIGWTDGRKLSPTFLDTILMHEPYRGALTRTGVRIAGAWFDQELDLEEIDLPRPLWLDRSRLDKDVNLSSSRTAFLSLEHSMFAGNLDMVATVVGRHLNLIGAKVRKLDMALASIGGSLFMSQGAALDEVSLIGAKIAGDLDLSGSKIGSMLNMDSATVGSHLFMSGGAEFADVDLTAAEIGGRIHLSGVKIPGKLNMDSATVGSHS